MKKYFLITLILALTAQINAQSNLVFNQVLDFRIDSGSPVTVPQGKVWKVEFVKGSQLIASKENVSYGVALNSTNFGNPGLGSSAVWFSEGTVLSPSTPIGMGISILEFNVVPISSSSGSSFGGGGVGSDGFVASGNIINLEFTGTNTSNNVGTVTLIGSITIPDGKIWKFNSYSFGISSNPGPQYGAGYDGEILIDGLILSDEGSYNEVFLSSGTYPVYAKASASGGGGT